MLCLICGMLQARRMEAGKHTRLMRSILHRHTSCNHKHVCCRLKAKLGGGRRGKKTHRRETGDRVLVISVPASQTFVSPLPGLQGPSSARYSFCLWRPEHRLSNMWADGWTPLCKLSRPGCKMYVEITFSPASPQAF